MANSFLTVDWLTMEGLRRLKNKLQVAQFFNTDYNKDYRKEFPVGETIRVPFPQRFTVRSGLGYNPQAINRLNTTVTVDQIFGIDFEWDSAEQALEVGGGMDRIKREYLDPAMDQLAQEIDSRAALWAYQNTSNIVGILGTDPTTTAFIAEARQRLIEQACPPSMDKGMIVPPHVNTAIDAALQSLFNPSSDISRLYKEGSLGRLRGFDWYESMSLYSHTAGTWAGAVTLSAAPSDGDTTLALTCTTGDTFLKGDKISIASTLPVNPKTRRAYGSDDKQFTVTADATGAGSAATISILPAIYGAGSQYQNVDALPASGDALTLFPGTTSPNGKSGTVGLALHRDAFALVGVNMEVPRAAEMAGQRRDPESGIAVRFVRMFDPQQSKMINRFDVLLGFGNLYQDNCAVAVLSA